MKRKSHYVDSKELEDWWEGYLVTGCPHAWEEMSDRIYKICCGIATHFNPRDEEEYNEHVHDAFAQTIDKINKRKLVFIRGKAPVFNLITTTVFRILYSKMNKQKKHRDHLKKYTYQYVLKHNPDLIENIEYPYSDHGSGSRSLSHAMA